MRELVSLQFGAKPWQPSETSRVIAVYDKHDRPTCGLIDQQGRTFLFDCIEGHAWDVNVWAYVEVTEDQVEKLTAAEGAEFATTVDRTLKGVPLVAALAVGDRLEMAHVLGPLEPGSNLYPNIMEAVLAKIERGTDAAETLRKVQPVS
ncbi:hypothetical protein AB0M50_00850 [Nonomuraea fuscirosea]|jgi:hypothetical protein|uniref:Uncharacterized protein n=1 Tax=Nonomuraea fuscirosea TaxID=1291556 RepID=A0A2T0MZL0_9ACTN|nr:hypothetical protein [Nonomuraea fuscirosea]PRX64813.1 hypothetical protein B0I32_108174 [Nonomuraea fuscirosea]WSA52132.1 hypothetical protein OIE67_50260 [Nonomuraea fuscirosea]